MKLKSVDDQVTNNVYCDVTNLLYHQFSREFEKQVWDQLEDDINA